MKEQISPGWKGFDEVGGRWLNLFARLKPGVTPASAQAGDAGAFQSDARRVSAEIQDDDPAHPPGVRPADVSNCGPPRRGSIC